MLYIFLAIMAGVSIVIARIINSNLAEKIGISEGTFFNYVFGLFFSVIFLLISKETLNISSDKLSSIPVWAYLGGLVGVIVIVLSSYITPRISAFYLTLIIFIGIIMDYLTLNKLSIGKVIGGLLVLAGLTYNLLIDKNKKLAITRD